MNIDKLYEKLQDENFLETLQGELTLNGNCIIWTFDLLNNSEEFDEDIDNDGNDDIESDELEFISPLEMLNEAYFHDLQEIETFIADLDENDWQFSDAEIIDNVISFKIF